MQKQSFTGNRVLALLVLTVLRFITYCVKYLQTVHGISVVFRKSIYQTVYQYLEPKTCVGAIPYTGILAPRKTFVNSPYLYRFE